MAILKHVCFNARMYVNTIACCSYVLPFAFTIGFSNLDYRKPQTCQNAADLKDLVTKLPLKILRVSYMYLRDHVIEVSDSKYHVLHGFNFEYRMRIHSCKAATEVFFSSKDRLFYFPHLCLK
jgi:hypothetical protein